MRTDASRFHNYAHLKADSPLRPIFKSGAVPIVQILIPTVALLPDKDEAQEVFLIDLDRLTPEQFERCLDFAHARANGVPREVVRKEIKASGLPLRALHVACTSSNCLAFL